MPTHGWNNSKTIPTTIVMAILCGENKIWKMGIDLEITRCSPRTQMQSRKPFCQTSYLKSLVDFSRVNVPVHCRYCGMWKGVGCKVWRLKKLGCWVGNVVCSVKWGLWSVECKVQRVGWKVWSVECKVWSVECKVWSVKSKVWSVECSVKCRVKCRVKCEVWSVECKV